MTRRLPQAWIEFAGELADAGGRVHRRYFGRRVPAEAKPDGSPVTAADRESEAAMRALIERRRPGESVWGEEFGRDGDAAGRVWILDPVDGTKSFVCGIPTCGLLIALAEGGRPVLGVVDHPALDDRWVGAAGHPTTRNGAPVRVRECPRLADAIVCAPGPRAAYGGEDEAIARVRADCRWVRYGLDCYAYGLLAAGLVDVVIDYGLALHDHAPLTPLIGGAGGRACDWSGRALDLDSGDRIVAVGDPSLLGPVLERLDAAA